MCRLVFAYRLYLGMHLPSDRLALIQCFDTIMSLQNNVFGLFIDFCGLIDVWDNVYVDVIFCLRRRPSVFACLITQLTNVDKLLFDCCVYSLIYTSVTHIIYAIAFNKHTSFLLRA